MASEKKLADMNRERWDGLVRRGNVWTVPVSSEQVAAARAGEVEIVLTPTRRVPGEWLGDLAGRRVLCLAGGGGQQAPLLAAAGAVVTTLDNSPLQLQRDRDVATREGLSLTTVLGVMEDLSVFADESFDLIVNPCSNCFTANVRKVWQEAARVLVNGGELLSGWTHPLMFVFDPIAYEAGELIVAHRIPYSDLDCLSETALQQLEEAGEPLLVGHSLEDQIGGQLAAGLTLIDLYEDRWDDPLSRHLDPFIATRAKKLAGAPRASR